MISAKDVARAAMVALLAAGAVRTKGVRRLALAAWRHGQVRFNERKGHEREDDGIGGVPGGKNAEERVASPNRRKPCKGHTMRVFALIVTAVVALAASRLQANVIVPATLWGGYTYAPHAWGEVDYGQPVPGYQYEDPKIAHWLCPRVRVEFDLSQTNLANVTSVQFDMSITMGYTGNTNFRVYLYRDGQPTGDCIIGTPSVSPHTYSGYWLFNSLGADQSSFDLHNSFSEGRSVANVVGLDGRIEFEIMEGHGDHTAGAQFYQLDPGPWWDEWIRVESAELQVIPEPATLSLLALGGLMALRRCR